MLVYALLSRFFPLIHTRFVIVGIGRCPSDVYFPYKSGLCYFSQIHQHWNNTFACVCVGQCVDMRYLIKCRTTYKLPITKNVKICWARMLFVSPVLKCLCLEWLLSRCILIAVGCIGPVHICLLLLAPPTTTAHFAHIFPQPILLRQPFPQLLLWFVRARVVWLCRHWSCTNWFVLVSACALTQ